jgi:hypothetical protein
LIERDQMEFYEITDKRELLEKYRSDWVKLKKMTDALPRDALDFVPDIPDAWSIREHLAHLMDAEIRAFVRYRNAVADPGAALSLGGGNVDRSNTLLDYASQDIVDSLEIIRLLRNITLKHVASMTDDQMMRYGIEHPDFGRINLRMVLSIYTQHVDKHIEYINRNITFFEERKASPHTDRK